MGQGKKRADKDDSGRGVLSGKNIVSITEKVFDTRNKHLFLIILIIGILLMIIPGGEKKNSAEMGLEEERLSRILSEVEGCGSVSVMITYNAPEKYGDDTSKAKGAVIVAEGADNGEVCNKISEAVQAALDLPPHKVKVYKSEK